MMCPKCGKEVGDTAGHVCAQLFIPSTVPERRPWRCPVCNGTGKVPTSTGSTSVLEQTCPGCGGKCIVWG